jgi:hypothetical protein
VPPVCRARNCLLWLFFLRAELQGPQIEKHANTAQKPAIRKKHVLKQKPEVQFVFSYLGHAATPNPTARPRLFAWSALLQPALIPIARLPSSRKAVRIWFPGCTRLKIEIWDPPAVAARPCARCCQSVLVIRHSASLSSIAPGRLISGPLVLLSDCTPAGCGEYVCGGGGCK